MEIKDIATDLYSEFKDRAKNKVLANGAFAFFAINHEAIINLLFNKGDITGDRINATLWVCAFNPWNFFIPFIAVFTIFIIPFANLWIRNFYYIKLYKQKKIDFIDSKTEEETAKYKLELARNGAKTVGELTTKVAEAELNSAQAHKEKNDAIDAHSKCQTRISSLEEDLEKSIPKEAHEAEVSDLKAESQLLRNKIAYMQESIRSIDPENLIAEDLISSTNSFSFFDVKMFFNKDIHITNIPLQTIRKAIKRDEEQANVEATIYTSTKFVSADRKSILTFVNNPTNSGLLKLFPSLHPKILEELKSMTVLERVHHIEMLLG